MILEKLKVKKILIPVLIIIFSLSVLLSGSGCKAKEAVNKAVETTSAAVGTTMAEATSAETTTLVVESAKDELKVNYPVTIHDDLGQEKGKQNREITLEKPIEKAIIGEQGCALTLLKFEIADKVVAGGCDFVAGYKKDGKTPNIAGYENIPVIGGYGGINVEKIIDLKPDIFINLAHHTDKSDAQLEAAGIRIYTVGSIKNLEGIKFHIKNYGFMFDKVSEATKIIDEMNAKEAKVKEAINALNLTDKGKPRVFMLGMAKDKDSVSGWAPGAETFVDDLIIKAGGINIFSEQGISGWAEYSSEALLKSNPDIIILPIGNEAYQYKSVEEFTYNPLVKNLTAVKNGKVYGIKGESITQMSWETEDALMQFAKYLHGAEINLD
ncbi:MAG: ABC transporter substrate-binding protein [Actinobacteria bacterium]|nr:ABC transporter substrate-binding protein [Actinomycetota bacterium]